MLKTKKNRLKLPIFLCFLFSFLFYDSSRFLSDVFIGKRMYRQKYINSEQVVIGANR